MPEQNVLLSADTEQARLDLIADNFARGRWELSGWVVVVLIASSGLFPTVSPGLTTGMIVWAIYQFAIAFCMHLALKAWRPGQPAGWFGIPRREGYIALHMLVGLGWGALPIVSLVPGSIPALAATAIVLVSVSAVQSARLSPHQPTYLAATLSLFVVGLPALATSGSELALLFAFAAPIWIFMVSTAALSLSRRIGQMIETRLENERLAASYASARDEAVAASRAKSTFLANMSHELRTPLNAIIGFSDVMKTGLFGHLNGRYQEYAEDIYGSGSHLLALVNDMLDLARIEAGRMRIEPQVFDSLESLDQVRRFIESKATSKGQNLTLDIEDGIGPIAADQRAFKQIALNLASNAVKFTQEGGAIAIALARSGDTLVLRVSDNGPGIAADKLTTIFNPFERGDDTYSGAAGGTGLGLALVNALAKLHGGHARIDSMIGQGTTVSVHLPDAIPAASMIQKAAA